MFKKFFNQTERIDTALLRRAFSTPPHFVLTPLNFLGLQIFRCLFELVIDGYRNSRWLVKKNKKWSNSIERKGYFLQSNFFEEKDFGEIKALAGSIISQPAKELAAQKILVANTDVAKRVLFKAENYDNYSKAGKRLMDLFFEKKEINDIATFIIRSEFYRRFDIEIERINTFSHPDEYDHNSHWHADRISRCAKAFFYLNDHNEGSGSYQYVAGSNKLNTRRVFYEFKRSIWLGFLWIRYLGKQRALNVASEHEEISTAEFQSMFEKKHLVECMAPENTILFSDNRGFHRRGVLDNGVERFQINLTFYSDRISFFWHPIWKMHRMLFGRHLSSQKKL